MNTVRKIFAEFYKMKHTFLPWLHILIPLGYSLFFFLAVRYTGIKQFAPSAICAGYFDLMASGLPLLLGIITAKVVEQEETAGAFLALFSAYPTKKNAFLTKLAVLVIFCGISIALGIFSFPFLRNQLPFYLLWYLFFFLLGCSVILYSFHLMVAFQWGKGLTVGIGIVETLLSLLFTTGIGDALWYYFPCCWGARLCENGIGIYYDKININDYYLSIQKCMMIAFPLTIVFLVGCMLWSETFEGRKHDE